MKYVICLIILLTAPRLFAEPKPSLKFKPVFTTSKLITLAEHRSEKALKILKTELKKMAAVTPTKVLEQSKRIRVKADTLSSNTLVLKALVQRLMLKKQAKQKKK